MKGLFLPILILLPSLIANCNGGKINLPLPIIADETKNKTIKIDDTFLATSTETSKSSRQNCEFTFNFDSAGQTAVLESPNYPRDYPPNTDCKYFLNSPPNTVMDIKCDDFNLEKSNNCQYDIFYVSQSGDRNFNDATYACGKGQYLKSSNANRLSVGFRSDSSNPSSSTPYRFQCQITTRSVQASCSCGVSGSASTRIVGGNEARVGQFPWRCALYTQRDGVFCGCTLLSNNWVLTAAHCTNNLRPDDDLYVNLGDHDLTSNTEAENQLILADYHIQNARYNDRTKDNDIAMIKLSKPVQFSKTIQPACLPYKYRNSDFSGINLIASGWGTMSFGGQQSHVLRSVELPYINTNECRNFYADTVTNNNFCTHRPGKDTCQGDSGGGIDFIESGTGRYYALGITSWGVGCGAQNQPGVYTDITKFLEWIEGNSGETFCKI